MIVGMALKKVFEGKTIKVGQDDVTVQFHFGDQKEFNFWVAEKMRGQQQKYPLIWYVIAPHERLANGKIKVDSQLYLFFGNKETSMMNDKRFNTSYVNYLEPTYKMVNEVLRKNPYTTLLNGTKLLPDYDEPNFGVESSDNNDFKTITEKGKKSISIDIVDAKILKLKMEINANCILSNNSTDVNSPDSGFVCSEGNKYIQISSFFSNPFVPSQQTNIRRLTSSEIINLWLDNENNSNGIGGLDIFICNNSFEIGTTLRATNTNEKLEDILNGYWLANQSGFSGNATINNVNIQYRFNPNRSVPYGLANPIGNAPIPFSFFNDTVEPVIIKIENSIVTEIIPLPMTGFAYEG